MKKLNEYADRFPQGSVVYYIDTINEIKLFMDHYIRLGCIGFSFRGLTTLDDTKYYCIAKDNHIYAWEFSKYVTIDVLNFKTGNFFLTREEAEQNKENIMKILNSPERFELK